MSRPEYPHTVTADLPGLSFDAARAIFQDQAKAGHLAVVDDNDRAFVLNPDHGLIGIERTATGIQAIAAAEDDRWMFIMKNAVVVQMKKTQPDLAAALRWSDADDTGAVPPTFTFVTVQSVEPLGQAFLRVVLKGDDFSAYGRESIHFRLVQPAKDGPPSWPTLAPNGSVKWPDGDNAPHKPVYTARAIDPVAGTLTVDIYLHEGGKTIAWAREVMAGDQTRARLGIMGPIGGGLLDDDAVILAADETGLPAAARILENLPAHATGQLLVETDAGQGADYPLNVPDGVRVTWLSRDAGDTLGRAMMDAMATPHKTAVWFAGERGQAAKVREFAKDAGWNPKELRVNGFWKA